MTSSYLILDMVFMVGEMLIFEDKWGSMEALEFGLLLILPLGLIIDPFANIPLK